MSDEGAAMMRAKIFFRGTRGSFYGRKTKLFPDGRASGVDKSMSSARKNENAPLFHGAVRVRLRENEWCRKTRLI